MSNSPYPGSAPDPQGSQNPPSGPLDPNFQHHTWTPPQGESNQAPTPHQSTPQQPPYPPAPSQESAPQSAYPPGASPQQPPYPPQPGAHPQPGTHQGHPSYSQPGTQPPYPQQANQQTPYPQQPYAQGGPQQPYPPSGYPQAAPKKNNTGKYVLLGLGGCATLFVLLIVAIGGLAYIGNQSQKNKTTIVTNSGTTNSSSSDDGTSGNGGTSSVATTTFTNSSDGLNPELKANYADFSFEYPASWQIEREGIKEGGSNFVKVKNDLQENGGNFTLENFAVGYFSGSLKLAPALMKKLEPSFANSFPNYSKVSEGPAAFSDQYPDAYELSFTAHTGTPTAKAASPFHLVQQSESAGGSDGNSGSSAENVEIYGKMFLIPASGTNKNGVFVVMLGTSKSPDLDSIDDLGVEGELPVIINSFRLGE